MALVVALLIAIVVLVVVIVVREGRERDREVMRNLRSQLARGEITDEQFHERWSTLRYAERKWK